MRPPDALILPLLAAAESFVPLSVAQFCAGGTCGTSWLQYGLSYSSFPPDGSLEEAAPLLDQAGAAPAAEGLGLPLLPPFVHTGSGAMFAPPYAAFPQVPYPPPTAAVPQPFYVDPRTGMMFSQEEARSKQTEEDVTAVLREKEKQLVSYRHKVASLREERTSLQERAHQAEAALAHVMEETQAEAKKNALEKQLEEAFLVKSVQSANQAVQGAWDQAATDLKKERLSMAALLQELTSRSDAELQGVRAQMAQTAGEAQVATARAEATMQAAQVQARELARTAAAADFRFAAQAHFAEEALRGLGAYQDAAGPA